VIELNFVKNELQQINVVMNCSRAVTLASSIEHAAQLCWWDSHAPSGLKVLRFPLHGNRQQPRAGESAHSCYKRVDFTQERRSIHAIRLPAGRLSASVALARWPFLLLPYSGYSKAKVDGVLLIKMDVLLGMKENSTAHSIIVELKPIVTN
jgi:hypothetical protein